MSWKWEDIEGYEINGIHDRAPLVSTFEFLDFRVVAESFIPSRNSSGQLRSLHAESCQHGLGFYLNSWVVSTAGFGIK